MKKYTKWKKYEAQAGREQHAGMEMGPQTKRKVQAEKVH